MAGWWVEGRTVQGDGGEELRVRLQDGFELVETLLEFAAVSCLVGGC